MLGHVFMAPVPRDFRVVQLVLATNGFCSGSLPVCSRRSGRRGWRSTHSWKASPGVDRAWAGPCSRPHWRKNRSAPIRLIGKKNGSKRHRLVDGRGVPLSFIVTEANRHDVTQFDAVLSAIMVERKTRFERRSKHLCLDAGCRGEAALQIIERHGYMAHGVSRAKENKAKQHHPDKKARRWVAEVCHSRFNHFRKLLMRYEKLERSFLALIHFAAGFIAFCKVRLTINIIYG